MITGRIEDMKGGWLIGDFSPAAWRTKAFELGYHKYHKGQKWPAHYHCHMDEINLMIRGTMKIREQIVQEGDYFIIHKNEIADPEFITDCEVIIVKTPSVPGDKVYI